MKKLTVHVGDTYEIFIEKGLLKDCGKYVRVVSKAKKIAIVTETNVAPLYLDTVKGCI